MDNNCEALRELNISNLSLIGGSSGGRVFFIDTDRVIKEYPNEDNPDSVKSIQRSMNYLYDIGIPIAKAYEVVKTENGYGIIEENIHGQSVGEIISSNPAKIAEYGEKMGILFKTLHKTSCSEGTIINIKDRLFSQIDRMEEIGYFNKTDCEYATKLLNAIPDDNKVIHYDFHEGNVIERNSEPVLIDTDFVCCGSPLFDLAFLCMNHVLIQFTPRLCKKALGMKPKYALRMYRYTLYEYLGCNDKSKMSKLVTGILPILFLLVALNMIRFEKSDLVNSSKIMKFFMKRAVFFTMLGVKRTLKKNANPFDDVQKLITTV